MFPPKESGRVVACTLFRFVAWHQSWMGEARPVAMTVAAGYCKDDPPTRTGWFSGARPLSYGMERSRNTVARRTPEGCGYQVSSPPEEGC